MEEIVVAKRHIKQVARGDSRGIAVRILLPRRRERDARGTILRRGASSKGCGQRWELCPAEQSRLQLLVCSKTGQVYGCRRVCCERRTTGHEAAVIPPVESDPRPAQPRLVLQVRSLVKLLVVVDAERC